MSRVCGFLEVCAWALVGDLVGLLLVAALTLYFPRFLMFFYPPGFLLFQAIFVLAITWACWKHHLSAGKLVWYPIVSTTMWWLLVGGVHIGYYPPRYYEHFQGHMAFFYITAALATVSTMLGAIFRVMEQRTKTAQQ